MRRERKRFGRWLGAVLVAELIAAFLATVPALAARPGSLDRSFGDGGIVTTEFTAFGPLGSLSGADELIQPDGRILVAGGYFLTGSGTSGALVARYMPDGSLDSSFGNGGLATPGVSMRTAAAALQPDGRIVLVGSTYNSATSVLARLEPDGSLDPTFGSGGVVTTTLGSSAMARAVALQPDGDVVIAGIGESAGQAALVVARFGAGGLPDGAFGTGGTVTATFGTAIPAGLADVTVLAQADGRIVAASADQSGLVMARYLTDGSVDASFGSAGKVTTGVGLSFGANGGLLQPDGKIVQTTFRGGNPVVARYMPDGSLDPSFGTSGLATPPASATNTVVPLLQPDGKLLVAGIHFSPTAFLVARLDAAGAIDPTFGSGGTATVEFRPNQELTFLDATGAALDSSGRIVVSGDVGDKICIPDTCYPGPSDLAAAALSSDGSLDTSFGDAGRLTTGLGIGSVPGTASAATLFAQPDGRLVVAGSSAVSLPDGTPGKESNFAAARYLANGDLDSSFGAHGRVVTYFGDDPAASDAHATAAATTADQGLIIAGRVGQATGVARYEPDGSLDPGFGDGGRLLVPSFPTPAAVAVGPNGNVILAGERSARSPLEHNRIAIARLGPDGSPDRTFGRSGEVDIKPRRIFPATLLVDPRGSIVVAGGRGLLRLRPDGRFDRSFGHRGIAPAPLSRLSSLAGALQDPTGRLTAFGSFAFRKRGRTLSGTAVIRYRSNGKLDRAYGNRGRVVRKHRDFARGPAAAMATSTGLVLVGNSNGPVALLRLKPSGSIDRSFGHRGRVISEVTGRPVDVVPAARGLIVVGGSSDGSFRLARFNG
jgi:uncharacterized delta-60 repeat protein